MTPKQKAEELIEKFKRTLNITDMRMGTNPFVKQCTLICCEEVINELHTRSKTNCEMDGALAIRSANFWQEVKKEIEK